MAGPDPPGQAGKVCPEPLGVVGAERPSPHPAGPSKRCWLEFRNLGLCCFLLTTGWGSHGSTKTKASVPPRLQTRTGKQYVLEIHLKPLSGAKRKGHLGLRKHWTRMESLSFTARPWNPVIARPQPREALACLPLAIVRPRVPGLGSRTEEWDAAVPFRPVMSVTPSLCHQPRETTRVPQSTGHS